jgi:hypothetical protein
MVRALREKSGAERLQIAFGMVTAARRMLRSSIGAKHPEWADEALEREVARRIAGGD